MAYQVVKVVSERLREKASFCGSRERGTGWSSAACGYGISARWAREDVPDTWDGMLYLRNVHGLGSWDVRKCTYPLNNEIIPSYPSIL